MDNLFTKFHRGLIVSCQAREEEPLHGSEFMAKMAHAAKWGGAHAIRANTPMDIQAIRKSVDLPIIGLYKYSYPGYEPYITPTFEEARQIAEAGADIIALDATTSQHPQESVQELIERVHSELHLPVLADISTAVEARDASQWGADGVATTLRGYTRGTKGLALDLEFLKEVLSVVTCPVIAEGRIRTPSDAGQMIEHGAFAVVVGSAITRPQEITSWYVQEIVSRNYKDEA